MSRERLTIRPLGGLRQGARGELGEAEEMVNFTVTDQGRLTLRPGVRALHLPFGFDTRDQEIRGLWAGFLEREELLAVATSPAGAYGDNGDYIQIFRREEGGFVAAALLPRPFGAKTAWVQFFPFCGALYALSDQGYVQISHGGISTGGVPGFRAQNVEPYVPLVVTGASPAGGGTALEQVNRLTDRRRISYSADGSAAYQLPEEAAGVASVRVNGEALESPGSFNALTRVYTFRGAPAAGTDNVEITYLAAASDRARILGMRCSEIYNGDTDTRLFLYGDGSNTCIYSGVTQAGVPSAAYFPAMNEIRVDGADAPITGLLRHGSSLLAFKPDGTWSITYSPLTLPDGTVTAGFYLRPLHRSLGNYAMGQAVLVENCPRTVTPGALYDWQLPEGYHRDERQAPLASGAVGMVLRGMDPWNAVALDDGGRGDYYLFHEGEVLVHRYRLGVWCRYRGAAFQGIRFGVLCGGEPVFAGAQGVYTLDQAAAWDYLPEKTPIEGVWQSGPIGLGRVRTLVRVELTLRPESGSGLRLSVATDRRGAWGECPAGAGRFRYGAVDYGRWSYNPSSLPQQRRLRIRARKCTVCRITLRPREPGCRGSVEEMRLEMTQ